VVRTRCAAGNETTQLLRALRSPRDAQADGASAAMDDDPFAPSPATN
jgi:hypothetical protein